LRIPTSAFTGKISPDEVELDMLPSTMMHPAARNYFFRKHVINFEKFTMYTRRFYRVMFTKFYREIMKFLIRMFVIRLFLILTLSDSAHDTPQTPSAYVGS
jgi:hypothetical protein